MISAKNQDVEEEVKCLKLADNLLWPALEQNVVENSRCMWSSSVLFFQGYEL